MFFRVFPEGLSTFCLVCLGQVMFPYLALLKGLVMAMILHLLLLGGRQILSERS